MACRCMCVSSGGGGGGGGGSPTLPTSGLTLALEAFGSGVYINQGTGLMDAWTNAVRSDSYWVPVGGTTSPAWTAAAINGTPAIVASSGNSEKFQAHLGADQTEDVYLTPQSFTFAGSIKYTGARVLNTASLRVAPLIVGANTDVPEAPSVSIALDPVDNTKVRIVLWWTPDDVTYHFVEGPALPVASPHYFVCTYSAPTPSAVGTLTMYIDAQPPTTTAGAPYSVLAQFQGQTMVIFQNGISLNSRLDADVGAIYAWNRALSATEITALQAYLKASGGY